MCKLEQTIFSSNLRFLGMLYHSNREERWQGVRKGRWLCKEGEGRNRKQHCRAMRGSEKVLSASGWRGQQWKSGQF